MPVQMHEIHLQDFIGGLNKVNRKNKSELQGATSLNGIIFPQKGVLAHFPGAEDVLDSSQIEGVPLFAFEYFNTAGQLIPIVYTEVDSDITTPTTENGTFYTVDLASRTATNIGTVVGGGVVDAFQFKAANEDEPVLIITSDSFHTQMWKYGDASIANLTGWIPTYADIDANPYAEQYTAATPEFELSDECRSGAAFANRAWQIPVTPDCKVVYSALFNCFDWENDQGDVNHGGHLDIKPGDGNGRALKLTVEKATKDHVERLLVWKERAVCAIVGDTPYDVYKDTGVGRPFEVITLIQGSGIGAPNSVVIQSNDTFYVNQNKQAKTVQLSISNVEAQELTVSNPIRPIFEKIPKKALRYMFTEDYIRRNQIWITHYGGFAEHEEDNVKSTTRFLYHLDDISPATKASGNFVFPGNPSNADTITVNGVVFTFVTGGSTATNISIGSDLASTLTEAAAVLNASVNASVTPATYSFTSTNKISILYDTPGTAGNAFTLAASVATPSSGTLTGGTASGHATDSSSNGYHLVKGGANSPINFRGFNGYTNDSVGLGPIAGDKFLALTTGVGAAFTSFTVSLWFKPKFLPTVADAKNYIFNLNHTAGKCAIYLHRDAGEDKIAGSIWDSSDVEQSIKHSETLDIGSTSEWHNAVITWDGTTFKFYFNGDLIGSRAVATMKVNGSNGIALGSSSAAAEANSYYGFVDEVYGTSVVKTAAQIMDFYSNVSRKNNTLTIFDYANSNWTTYDGIGSAAFYYDGKHIYSLEEVAA